MKIYHWIRGYFRNLKIDVLLLFNNVKLTFSVSSVILVSKSFMKNSDGSDRSMEIFTSISSGSISPLILTRKKVPNNFEADWQIWLSWKLKTSSNLFSWGCEENVEKYYYPPQQSCGNVMVSVQYASLEGVPCSQPHPPCTCALVLATFKHIQLVHYDPNTACMEAVGIQL